MARLQLTTYSPEETEKLGAELGALLTPGFFVALRGELGGGKTCLTRGLVKAVAPESSNLVASPTYAIMNIYQGTIPVYHFDFYRLVDDDDIYELGFEDFFYGDGVSVVEWSERLTDLMPADVLTIIFEYLEGDSRLITLESRGTKSGLILEQLTNRVKQ